MALLRGAMGLSAVGIVVFPNHTHYFSFGSLTSHKAWQSGYRCDTPHHPD